MGKHKNKKIKHMDGGSHVPNLNSVDGDLLDMVEAIDGHNTQGWTDDEIRAYNDLVLERQRLEEQRHELEEKCAKSQTQRALLHENAANIDSLFQQRDSMSGIFVFGGLSNCCVDPDAPDGCTHEICKRAKQQGVSALELDTIRYYSMRIHNEKSERIRSALRKQRDLELLRVKKEEDDSQAQVSKRVSKKTKPVRKDASGTGTRGLQGKELSAVARETENIVNKIIGQLDDLRSDLQTGRITAEEAQSKLNILDSKLPSVKDGTLHKPTQRGGGLTDQDVTLLPSSFQSHLQERLLGTQGDVFSQAFSIMDHFLGATKPTDLHGAISQLKDVLQLTGPMCEELQNSLGALEGIFDHPDKLSFTGPDGKQECSSIMDLMEKLKETLKRTGQLPDGANASLTKVFQACIDIEAEAINELNQKCTDDTITSAELPTRLAHIKENYVAKSPIPPLTSNKLESEMVNALDIHDATQLLVKAGSGVGATELEACITSLVISRTQKQTGKYIEKLESLSVACRAMKDESTSSLVSDAIVNVLSKMRKWITRSDAKGRDQPKSQVKVGAHMNPNSQSPTTKKLTEGISDTQIQSPPALSSSHIKSLGPQTTQIDRSLQEEVRASVKRVGLWHTFDIHRDKTSFGVNSAMARKFDGFKADTRALNSGSMSTVEDTVYHLYKLGLCPGIVAALVSYALCEIAQQPDHDFQAYMKQFSTCVERLPPPISIEWSNTFQRLTLAMTQLYVAVFIEALAVFPSTPPAYFAISTVEAVTRYTLLGQTKQTSREDLTVFTNFFAMLFGQNDSQFPQSLEDAFSHYKHFCNNDQFRCTSAESCSKHVALAQMPFRTRPQQSQKVSTAQAMSDNGTYENTSRMTVDPMLRSTPTDAHNPISTDAQPLKKIKAMKTVVYYPPDHPNRQGPQQPCNPKADLRYAQSLGKARALYESTARKAFVSLTLCHGHKDARSGPAPDDFLFALNKILQLVEYHTGHTFNGVRPAEARRAFTATMPPGFDDSEASADLVMESALNLHDHFKQISVSKSASYYIHLTVNTIHERAKSGCYSDPFDAVNKFESIVAKAGKIPDALQVALLDVKTLLQASLANPIEHSAFKTRRVKHLLSTVGALEPTISSLQQMALQYPSAFCEYQKIVLDKLEHTTIPKVRLLEQSLSAIIQVGHLPPLSEASPSLLIFAEQAKEDWDRRLQNIVDNTSIFNEHAYLDYAQGEASKTECLKFSPAEVESATIARSPARQPIIEQLSVEASIVPSHASVSSTEPFSPSETLSDEAQIDASQGLASPKTLVIAHEKPAFDDHGNRKEVDKSTEDISPSSCQNRNLQELSSLLSPNGNEVNSDEDVDGDESDPVSESIPAPVRMAEMMKWIRALQQNCVDLAQTAEDVHSLDARCGLVFRGLADKVKTQVSSYADFVAQIAEWNDVDLAEVNLELDRQNETS